MTDATLNIILTSLPPTIVAAAGLVVSILNRIKANEIHILVNGQSEHARQELIIEKLRSDLLSAAVGKIAVSLPAVIPAVLAIVPSPPPPDPFKLGIIMSVDPNQVVDTSANVAKAAVSAGKAFWKSKTFWANVVLAASAYFHYIPANQLPYVGVVANILLRFLTVEPISLTGK